MTKFTDNIGVSLELSGSESLRLVYRPVVVSVSLHRSKTMCEYKT